MNQEHIPIEEVMRRTGCKRSKAFQLVSGHDRIDGPRMANGKPKSLYSAACLDGVSGAMKAGPAAAEPAPGGAATTQSSPEKEAKAPEAIGLTAEQQSQTLARWQLIQPVMALKNGHRRAAIAEQASSCGKSERMLRVYVERYEGKAKGKYSGVDGLAALADAPRADKGEAKKVNAASEQLIKSLVLEGNFSSLQALYEERYLRECDRRKRLAGCILDEEDAERLRPEWFDADTLELKPEGVPAWISYETFRLVARRVPQSKILLARGEIERYDNTQVPFSRRAYERMDLMDYVVMDHRELDIFCLFWEGGKWAVGRPWSTVALDMRSRRILSCRIVRTPNSDSIASAIREVLVEHGRPKHIYIDNGQDFESKYVSDILRSAHIKVVHSIVKRARSKSIEPNFKRFQRFERDSEHWVGANPQERPQRIEKLTKQAEQWLAGKKKERPLSTLEEIQELFRDVVVPTINNQQLDGEGMRFITPKGKEMVSPNECWGRLAHRSVREEVPLTTIQVLMRERRVIKVRHGQIEMRYAGELYIFVPAMEYGAGALYEWNDKKVELWIDRYDLGSVIAQHDGRMVVCRNFELRGMGEEQFKQDEALRRRLRKTEREAVAAFQAANKPLSYIAQARKALNESTWVEPKRPSTVVIFPEQERQAAAIAANGGRGISMDNVPDGPRWVVKQPEQGEEFDFYSDLKNDGGDS